MAHQKWKFIEEVQLLVVFCETKWSWSGWHQHDAHLDVSIQVRSGDNEDRLSAKIQTPVEARRGPGRILGEKTFRNEQTRGLVNRGLIELWPSNQVNSGLNSNLNNQWVLGPITNIMICCCFQSWKPAESRKNHGQFEQLVSKQTVCTAVKSNALAELMNRASKIHWKNLSWLLNGR